MSNPIQRRGIFLPSRAREDEMGRLVNLPRHKRRGPNRPKFPKEML